MDIGTLIGRVASDPVFVAIYVSILLSIVNFVVGSIKAWQNESFEGEKFDSWIKSDGGKIAIFTLFLLLGKAVALVDVSKVPGVPGDLVSAGIIVFGLLQAGSFILATLDALKEKVLPNPALKAKKVAAAAAANDPQPDA